MYWTTTIKPSHVYSVSSADIIKKTLAHHGYRITGFRPPRDTEWYIAAARGEKIEQSTNNWPDISPRFIVVPHLPSPAFPDNFWE